MQNSSPFCVDAFFALVVIALITALSIEAEVGWANNSHNLLLAEVANSFEGGE